MFKYPWTNLHELNMDWIIQQVRDGLVDHGCGFVRPEDFPESETPIQDAMDAAASDGKIVLLSGQYTIEETVSVPAGVTVIGTNNAELLSSPKDAPGFCPTTIFQMESGTTVCNVIFNGNRPDGASQSITPSDVPPGDSFERAPLVLLDDVQDITFIGCTFKNYDSNRTTAQSWQNAVIGAHQAFNVQIERCRMFDCRREGWCFEFCGVITIDRCYISMQGDPGDVYTEIGLGQTNDVQILNSQIYKADSITTSVINAMGDNIEVRGCHIRAVNSVYGIDYGNEISADFTADNLLISECTLECHISGATAYPIDHNNIRIINNLIIATDIASGSGVIAVYGSNNKSFEILNNHFYGTTLAHQGIRIGNFSDLRVSIIGNTFEGPAIWISETVPPMDIANNWFKSDAIYQTTADLVNSYIVTMMGCKCDRAGRFGVLDVDNLITIHLVGCDFRRSVCTNAYAVDASLSYIRGV